VHSMSDTGLGRHVGDEVRRRRLQRGWTLAAAATRLGVSRRLLVQIEQGEANPSLSSLLSIAAGFEVPLVDLLSGEVPPTVTVQTDSARAPALWTGGAGGAARLLVASGGIELGDWALEPGDERTSDAHRTGSREALTVTEGVVCLEVGGTTTELRAGQSAAFAADVDHSYANRSAASTRFLLAVHEPG
jgi:transcriptional regulator with XRE-family HTH domain